MADELTSHERMSRVFRREEPDRVPMNDAFWGSTIERWRAEGLPAGVSPNAHFGFEKIAFIGNDNSPRYPQEVLEETDEYRVYTTSWGVTQRTWSHRASVPEFLDFTVVDRETWADARERMKPARDRVPWETLEKHYANWRAEGRWILGGGWFGFDVLHSWFVGTERVMMALVEDPEWVKEMVDAMLELNIANLEMAWDAGYRFDAVTWPDDLGYVNGLLISPSAYREVVKPAHKRWCDWAHDRGVYTQLHSCGGVMDLIPDLIEAGVDMLQPLEQKAGMDVFELKRKYGDKLALEGGIDVRRMTDAAAIEEEIRSKLPVLMEGGGYCYHSDHSVPDNVSFADYTRVVDLVKRYGRYA